MNYLRPLRNPCALCARHFEPAGAQYPVKVALNHHESFCVFCESLAPSAFGIRI